MSDEVARALEVARGLARIGVPIFLARPWEDHASGFARPNGWQHSAADPAVLDDWRPGMAVCMLTGCGLDLVDLDPRNRPAALGLDGLPDLPDTWAMAYTPSGGVHHLVPPIGESSLDGVVPGLDIKAGRPDGSGRGYAFLAPTVRRSKVTGEEHPYRWVIEPDPEAITAHWQGLGWDRPHPSVAPIARLIRARRAERRLDAAPRRVPASVAAAERERVLAALVADLRHWAAAGWGGEAHSGLLAATTYLARIDPESAEAAFCWAFEQAGLEPDDDDMAKLESAVDQTTPDVVVPDEQLDVQELFFAGAAIPEHRLPREAAPMPGFLAGVGGPTTPGVSESNGEEPGRGFRRYLDEYELEKIPEPERLAEGLLWSSTVARLYGDSTVGKTFVALDLAAHVANGMPWQGLDCKQVPVGYVAAEGAPGIAARLRAWRGRHDRDSQVRVWPEPVLVGGAGWPDFVADCADRALGLVVLDTQAACTVGYAENSNSDAQIILTHLGQLVARTGCCVLLVHHVGLSEGERARGASGMFGGLDTELRLGIGRGSGVVLSQRKQKYAERGKALGLTLERYGESLVVAPRSTAAAPREHDEHRAAEVYAHVAALEANHVDSGKSQRFMVSYLRDLGRAGGNETMHDAARLYRHRCGIQGVTIPSYLLDPSSLVQPLA